MKILKIPLKAERGIQVVELNGPFFSILDVQFQEEQLVMWFLTPGEEIKIPVSINIVYTGEESVHLPFGEKSHIATVQSPKGLVLHIFEIYNGE